MPYSYTELSGKHPGDTITVSWPFEERSEVSIKVDGISVNESYYEWVNDGLINCLTGFPFGQITRIERNTNLASLPGEQSGPGTFDWDVANRNDKRLLFAAQERADKEDSIEPALEEVQVKLNQATDLVNQTNNQVSQATESAEEAALSALKMDTLIDAIEAGNFAENWGNIVDVAGEIESWGAITS